MKKIKHIACLLLAAVMTLTPLSAAATDTAAAEQTAIDCRYVRFDTTPNMYKYNAAIHAGMGNYKPITEGEGAPYLALLYDDSVSNYSPYIFSFKFLQAGYVNTQYKYVRVTYRTTDPIAAQLNFVNTSTEDVVTLVENTSASSGEWVTSEAVDTSKFDILNRLAKGSAVPMQYTATWEGSDFAIREIVFFKTVEDAYRYYGEEPPVLPDVTVVDYATGGVGDVTSGANYGSYTFNAEDECLDITYAESTNIKNIHYMAKLRTKTKNVIPADVKYVRVEYSATNPAGAENVVFKIQSDATVDKFIISEDLQNTDGFVLTQPLEVTQVLAERFAKGGHSSATTTATEPGGLYRIKNLYFFKTLEDAEAFSLDSDVTPDHKIKIAGNDISKYNIVISDEAPVSVENAARAFKNRVLALTGTELPIITDTSPEGEYEILIGQSNRKASYEKLRKAAPTLADYRSVTAYVDGNDLVMTAILGTNVTEAVDYILYTYLGVGLKGIPATIAIDSIPETVGSSVAYSRFDMFEPHTNVADPEIFTVDFTSDEGYFGEDSGCDYWKADGGKYKVNAVGRTFSYVQVLEANATVSAELSYSSKSANAKLGLSLRHADEGAYVKAGYDFDKGEWFVDYREGKDFSRIRAAEAKGEFKAGETYLVTLTADGNNVTLSVNGKEVISCEILHVSPGVMGLFADNITAGADNFTATLLSGESTVLRNVTHVRLPDEEYREGGTVVELSDGSWYYQHHSGRAFISRNNGATWERHEVVFPIYGYQQVLRLNNGQLMQIGTADVDGVKHWASYTSADDGKTWTKGGIITPCVHTEKKISGSNMNDKLTQSGTTNRIYYSLNYEDSTMVNGNKSSVFCEYFYSDDNGKTWKMSEDASYTLEGNEGVALFGENKILQCADGTVRMYASWHKYGEIVYAESSDGGVTFGPITHLEGFSTTHSSMQFARDPYGPTDTTYYMVWIYAEMPENINASFRPRLSLAYTEDGKSWEYLGDLWYWETGYRPQTDGTGINHLVDPFVTVTKDHVICGSGVAERVGATSHNEQRQHIWAIEKATLPEGKKLTAFEDLDLGAPYYDAVIYAVDNGLFNGTSTTTFEPNTAMNRAMFVTVLGRLDKADVAKYTKPTFSDVESGQWYTSYVEWAAANGIVNGIGGGKYGVTGTVTVEQALTILYRYNGGKASEKLGGVLIEAFPDASKVSSWAADGVKWAVENGIYAGVGGKLNPTDAASRATVATMFANYVKAFG